MDTEIAPTSPKKAKKNPFGKQIPIGQLDKAYWNNGDQFVLKMYQHPAKMLENPHARVFVAANNHQYGYDYGDQYITAIPGFRSWLINWVRTHPDE